MQKILLFLCSAAVMLGLLPATASSAQGEIIVGPKAPPLEQYAARELQRYLYQVTGEWLQIVQPGQKSSGGLRVVLGQRDTNPALEELCSTGQLQVKKGSPGEQGYLLKTLQGKDAPTLVILGNDAEGALYGVYGLLEDYFDVRFYLGGDVLPDKKLPLRLPAIDERKTPAVRIRGFLPWTNFPQSATSYSWEDWKFIIDQMAKMRMNFLHIHNYNGEAGHNEMFHNFTINSFTSRTWMATARSGHAWGSRPGWDPNRYLFGAADLFGDYDAGADCALHNERLTNEEVFCKGASMFQQVIAYAHSRGVKIGLGLDINLIPQEYKLSADDPQVVAARVRQIVTDYPDLDYLLCFQSEGLHGVKDGYKAWQKMFMGFYEGMKQAAPRTRLAVAGWGLRPETIADLPPDVICAPISAYRDTCENGSIYGSREYWGCPWLERDFNSSEYYYPYNLHLTNTIASWNARSTNFNGFYCLSWRLTDAVEPKMWYLAQAPWDSVGRFATAEVVYRDYAEHNYGKKAAAAITPIINNDEPFASNFGECQSTPQFTLGAPDGHLLNVAWFKIHSGDSASAKPIPAAGFTSNHGINTAECSEGGQCVGWIEDGDWISFQNVDFGQGATSCEARVAAATTGGLIELRLEAPNGPLVGVIDVPHTGGWQTWTSSVAVLSRTAGQQKLVMHFKQRPVLIRPQDLVKDAEFTKANEQLRIIDEQIAATESPSARARLGHLRCRIAGAKDHIEMNYRFSSMQWNDLPGPMESWARSFVGRVTDISSLGNVMSTQNRFVQKNYLMKERELRDKMNFQPPANVNARGTLKGAIISWENRHASARGFYVYRNGKRVNAEPLPPSACVFEDEADGSFVYTVKAIDSQDRESTPSLPVRCHAGPSDKIPPQLVVISPPTSAMEGEPVWVKVRVLDDRVYEALSATLHYRKPGSAKFTSMPMTRQTKATFTVAIPGRDVTAAGLEYYFEANDGNNQGAFPPAASASPLALTAYATSSAKPPSAPLDLKTEPGQQLTWKKPARGNVVWYRIYRSQSPDFVPGPDTWLTYVAGETTRLPDNGLDRQGHALHGDYFYRVTAVDAVGRESAPTKACKLEWPRQ